MEFTEAEPETIHKNQESTSRSTKQSTFSIDSILSHKMLSQQFKETSGDHILSDTMLDEKPLTFEKSGTDQGVEMNKHNTHAPTRVEDRYACAKQYSSMTNSWCNTLSCSCPNCTKKKSRDRTFMSNRPIRDLSHVSYYGNIYDSPYYQRNNATRYMEDPASNLKLSFRPSDDDRHSKRRRTIFTASQLERLEYEFQQQQYIVGQDRRYLARELHLNEVQVKVWFQNRRIKWRKYTHGYYTDASTIMVENDE